MDRQVYHIRVRGHGGPLWDEWFAGLSERTSTTARLSSAARYWTRPPYMAC